MNKKSNKLYPYPVKIAGIGRCLPNNRVATDELESRCGLPEGRCESAQGVLERRWALEETQSLMGAAAAKEAVLDAGMELFDIDFIINASVSFERVVPDGGPLLQRQLGLDDSGIPSTTMQAGCESFLWALDICANLLAVDRYKNILIISSEIMSPMLDCNAPEAFTLFGDGAAAVVVTAAQDDEMSCIHDVILETYGHGVPFLQSSYGLTAFRKKSKNPESVALKLDAESFNHHGIKYVRNLVEELCKDYNADDLKLVIPQQSGNALFDALGSLFPTERLVKTYDRLGHCGAASYPMALYEAVKTGRLKRNDLFLMAGFGAGVSVSAMLMTY